MAEGLERRAKPQDNLKGRVPLNPVTKQVPQVGVVGGVPTPSVPDTSYAGHIANQVTKFAGAELAQQQKKAQERSLMDGQIAQLQGKTFDEVEMEGDKFALHGYKVMSAQSLSATLLRAQQQEIENGAYESTPEQYRQNIVDRIQSMTDGIEDEGLRKMTVDGLMEQVPSLLDAHMTRHLGFQEQQNFDALTQSVGIMSTDPSKHENLVSFANGTSTVTAGLSAERRKAAVTQGIVHAFENNNPKAFAILEDADFINTDNLTSSQLQAIRKAQNAYETRIRQQWNAEFTAEMAELADKVNSGSLNPLEAAEAEADIRAKHGMRMRASEGNQIYARARTTSEIEQGTRGLNIQAAGESGDYGLQARLMQDAVIQQESGGNTNAVSPVGALGLMQVMPATARDPGLGVRNVFEVAADLGFDVADTSETTLKALLRDPEVNSTLGTEYLTALLKRYSGNVDRALVAYNWGPGNADNWNGDPASLPAETRNYIKKVGSNFSDDRPDVSAQRVEAERNLAEIREVAQLEALESMGPSLAELDELFVANELGVADWQQGRRELYAQWGIALNAQRVNQEQQMLRSVAADRIAELQAVGETERQVALKTSLEAAEVQLEEAQNMAAAGKNVDIDAANQAYMQQVIEAYDASGVTIDPSEVSDRAANLVRSTSETVAKAIKAQEEQAIIMNAETANTVGSLPANLRTRAVDQFREQLQQSVENYRAENPDASVAEIAAVQREAEVKYLAQNNIVDEALQQQINLAASGNWIDSSGQPRPSTVVGLHSFVSMMAENPSLAYQYVPDAQARGRMLAASHLVTTMFPSETVFTRVDLSNRNDPVANAFYDAVQQVGLAANNTPSAEETADRVNKAVDLIDRGNITNTLFGGWFTSGASETLAPGWLGSLGATFDLADANAARSVDNVAVDIQFTQHVEDFLQEVVPYMPGTSQQGAVTMALDYVRERGALMGSSYVMPDGSQPSIRSQMFPGQVVENTAAVNTAIVQWLGDEATQEANPRLRDFHAGGILFRPDEFTVTRLNGNYVANIVGVGSVVLPLQEIGNRYIANR